MLKKKGQRIKPVSYHNPKRYRLSFTNENTLNRIWSFSMTRRRLLWAIVAVIAVICLFVVLLLSVTPLHNFLPGAMSSREYRQWVSASQAVDSLAVKTSINQQYLANLRAILNDEIDVDSIKDVSMSDIIASDSLLAPSETEKEFIRSYEEREKYNTSVLAPIISDAMAFVPPVRNAVISEAETPSRPTITLTDPVSTIDAVYRGTVIDSYHTPADGYVVIIAHPNDFISRYSGLTDLYVSRGDKVNAGSRIGSVRSSASVVSRPFAFEIRRNGILLNPSDLIVF